MRKALTALTALTALLTVGCWQVAAIGAQLNTEQTARAVTASTGQPLCLKGQHLRGSGSRGYYCWFRKHGQWYYEGVECQPNYQRANVRRRGHMVGQRCVPTPHAAAPPTPAPAPVAPVPAPTPVTVYNVCTLNPGLGVAHPTNINGYPTVYWVNPSGQLAMLAYSNDGNSAVDIAVIPTEPGGSTPLWIARCNWPEWINFAAWQQQANTSAAAGLNEISSENYATAYNIANDEIAAELGGIDAAPSAVSPGDVVTCGNDNCIVESG